MMRRCPPQRGVVQIWRLDVVIFHRAFRCDKAAQFPEIPFNCGDAKRSPRKLCWVFGIVDQYGGLREQKCKTSAFFDFFDRARYGG